MNEKEKNIYIVLTYTGTILSRIIKSYTHAEYAHVSIALDDKLDQMYSFGRINAYIPFIGGYVKEGVNKGTFKRFKNTQASIYTLKVSQEQYDKVKDIIDEMYKNKEIYKFNIIGLFANGLNIKFKKRKNYFYCAEFIEYVFRNAKININLPKLVKPNDFKYLKDLELEYKGKLNSYLTD